jgi:hypothetical protein
MLTKNSQYTLISEHKFDAGPGKPPELRKVRLLRDGEKYSIVIETQGDTYALLVNDRYTCKLTKSSVPGKWMLNDYRPAGTDTYEAAKVQHSSLDFIKYGISADQILLYWEAVKDVSCELRKGAKAEELTFRFEFSKHGRDLLSRRRLNELEVPSEGRISLDLEKLQRGEPDWLLSWDMRWSLLLEGQEFIRHKRVEASEWKRFAVLESEIPTLFNSFTDETGEELWYRSRKIKEVTPLMDKDKVLFYMSGFGLTEIERPGNRLWITMLISILSAIALFLFIRRLGKSR